MRVPSGDQAAVFSAVAPVDVTRRAPEPSAFITQMSPSKGRFEATARKNKRRVPSGDQRGSVSVTSLTVSRRVPVPSVRTVKISEVSMLPVA